MFCEGSAYFSSRAVRGHGLGGGGGSGLRV